MKDTLQELAEEVHARLPQAVPDDPAGMFMATVQAVLAEWSRTQPARWADAVDQIEQLASSNGTAFDLIEPRT